METKSLYDVLPPALQVVAQVALVKLVDRKLILQDAKLATAGDTTYSHLTLYDEVTKEVIKATANQTQIAEVCKFLLDQSALPVYVKIINHGKSYAMVDPSYNTTSASPTNP